MKKYEKKICSNTECKKKFEAKVYNAIYCSQECRRTVTNKNLLNNYYEKKRNKHKKRVCAAKICTTVFFLLIIMKTFANYVNKKDLQTD